MQDPEQFSMSLSNPVILKIRKVQTNATHLLGKYMKIPGDP